MTDEWIGLSDICFHYPGRPPVLDHLNFHLHPHDQIGLVAPNGSGKTTLFHVIMGLLRPHAGTVRLFGRPMRAEADFAGMRGRIGLLFQDADDQLFSPTVLEDVAFGPLNLGKTRADALDISRQTLAFLGLSDFENRITFTLSGGEKRLVALATVLSMQPQVLLLDEPATGLDTATRQTLIQVLQKLDLTRIIISHDFDFLSQTTTRICGMENGRIVWDDALYPHTHQHVHKMGKQPHRHI